MSRWSTVSFDAVDQRLFVYGTLRNASVQVQVIGREALGEPDKLLGWTLDPLEITNPEVLRISGERIHRIARRTGNPADFIPGEVLSLSREELEQVDPYEADNYVREAVQLESGLTAWFYCRPQDALTQNDLQ